MTFKTKNLLKLGCSNPNQFRLKNNWCTYTLAVSKEQMCNFWLDMNYLRKTKPGQAISHTSKVLHGLGLERFSQ